MTASPKSFAITSCVAGMSGIRSFAAVRCLVFRDSPKASGVRSYEVTSQIRPLLLTEALRQPLFDVFRMHASLGLIPDMQDVLAGSRGHVLDGMSADVLMLVYYSGSVVRSMV